MATLLLPILFCLLQISYCQSTTTKSVSLSTLNPSEDGANVTLLKDTIIASLTDLNSSLWRLTASDEIGFHLQLSLDESWSFHPTQVTTLTLYIHSNNTMTSTATDLLVSFSQSNNIYFTVKLQLDKSNDNGIYPSCDNILPYTQSYGSGNVKSLVNTNNGLSRESKITDNLNYSFIDYRTYPPIISYPLTFILEHHPIQNYLLFTYTNPDMLRSKSCGYIKMQSNIPLDIYFAVGDINESFNIYSMNITHQYQQTNDWNICSSGDCTFNCIETDCHQIVCTDAADSCTVNCGSRRCENGNFYLAATRNIVNCIGSNSCKTSNFYCGIPDVIPNNMFTTQSFDGHIEECKFILSRKAMSSDGFIKCSHDIDLCIVETTTNSEDFKFKDSKFLCNLTPLNSQCIINCYDEESCGEDTSHFICNAPNCQCTGNGCNALNITKAISLTINGTTNPSKLPTNHPTSVPTNNPSKLPTNAPTSVPSNKSSSTPIITNIDTNNVTLIHSESTLSTTSVSNQQTSHQKTNHSSVSTLTPTTFNPTNYDSDLFGSEYITHHDQKNMNAPFHLILILIGAITICICGFLMVYTQQRIRQNRQKKIQNVINSSQTTIFPPPTSMKTLASISNDDIVTNGACKESFMVQPIESNGDDQTKKRAVSTCSNAYSEYSMEGKDTFHEYRNCMVDVANIYSTPKLPELQSLQSASSIRTPGSDDFVFGDDV